MTQTLPLLSCEQLNVHVLPEQVQGGDLAGHAVVVIDVLRATTTLAQALASGAAQIFACRQVDEAMRVRAADTSNSWLLGGERGGVPLPGFDLGNSPLEYTPARVAGRTIVFTTTNGTRALDACRSARLVVAGAFVNREALLAPLADATHIDLVCAGTEGEVSWEDTLFAGSLVDRILEVGTAPHRILNEGAQAAWSAWRQVAPTGQAAAALGQILRRGRGGRNLLSIGREEDIDWAAQIDCLNVVPWYRPSDGRLVPWTTAAAGKDRGPDSPDTNP